jgi:hypothetical protein
VEGHCTRRVKDCFRGENVQRSETVGGSEIKTIIHTSAARDRI